VCYRATDDGQWEIELNGALAVPDSELIHLLNTITFADPANPSTWYPIG
jgi:hypothetical protein